MRHETPPSLSLWHRWQLVSAVIVSSLSIPPVWTACNVAFQYANGAVSSLIIVPHITLSLAYAFARPYPLCIFAAFILVTICRFTLQPRNGHVTLRPLFFVATSSIMAAAISISFTVLLQSFWGISRLDFATDLFIVFRDSATIFVASAFVCVAVSSSSLKAALQFNAHPVG